MRRTFQETLLLEMKNDDKIFLLVGDLGYKMWDNHFKEFPDRTINCGASEQAMLDIAVGLAYDGKIPVCYSITPFLIYRPFETLRTYIDYEKLPVKLVGSGRNKDYSHDGVSHWADDIGLYLGQLNNIKQFWPKTKKDVEKMTHDFIYGRSPAFISLAR